jgi:hypothetical protein
MYTSFKHADIQRTILVLRSSLLVGVLRLQTARVLLVTNVVGVEGRLVASEGNWALLLSGHAAGVEQARPKDDPNNCQYMTVQVNRHEPTS